MWARQESWGFMPHDGSHGGQSRGATCLDLGLEKIVLAAARKTVTGRRGDGGPVREVRW